VRQNAIRQNAIRQNAVRQNAVVPRKALGAKLFFVLLKTIFATETSKTGGEL
jgi:hypothetical protein